MTALKYELLINNTPYYENLINELQIVFNQKKKLISSINIKEIENLSLEEKGILNHLFKKENELLFEILKYKKWFGELEEKIIAERLGIDMNEDDDDSDFKSRIAFNAI